MCSSCHFCMAYIFSYTYTLDQCLLFPKLIIPMQRKSNLESVVKHKSEEYLELHLRPTKQTTCSICPGRHYWSGGGRTSVVPQLRWEDGAVLQITSGITPTPQIRLQQGPWKTSLMGVPCKGGRWAQNVPVTIDSGLSNGGKLKAKFCFWLRSIVGNKTEQKLTFNKKS